MEAAEWPQQRCHFEVQLFGESKNWMQLLQLSYPSPQQIANATSLTLGLYQFELSVSDENNNTATDTTWVKIVQGGSSSQDLTEPLTHFFF